MEWEEGEARALAGEWGAFGGREGLWRRECVGNEGQGREEP